jgi:hypothetical protein
MVKLVSRLNATVTKGLQDIGGASPPLASYQFVSSSGTKEATVLLYDADGLVMAEETLTVGTTPLLATDNTLWDGSWDQAYAGMQVLAADAGIYALPTDGDPAVSAANGMVLTAGMALGAVPQHVSGLGGGTGSGGGLPSLSPQTAASQAVTTAPLRVLGATNWTLATANGAVDRLISLTNHDTSYALYVSLVAVGASLTGAVAADDYELQLGPGDSLVRFQVPAGFDLVVVRGAGTGDVRAQEFLL